MKWLAKLNGGRVPGPQETDYRPFIFAIGGILLLATLRLVENVLASNLAAAGIWPFGGR